MSVAVRIKPLHPELGKAIPLPRRMSEHASGYDVAAAIDDAIVLAPGERRLIPCGFAMAVPPGYECQVRARSGLALKHGIAVLNGPGTIDADYRGQCQVLLANLSDTAVTITRGMRIAQFVIAPVPQSHMEVVEELDDTERGAGGFGSTQA